MHTEKWTFVSQSRRDPARAMPVLRHVRELKIKAAPRSKREIVLAYVYRLDPLAGSDFSKMPCAFGDLLDLGVRNEFSRGLRT